MSVKISSQATIICGAAAQVGPTLVADQPGALLFEFANFGIDDSRFIKERSARLLAAGETQFWILACAAITLEAQNALLKVLEEPGAGHHFVFILPSLDDLLPTLRSRCEIIDWPTSALARPAAKKFLAAGPEARLDQVQKLVKTHEGEPALTRRLARELVDELIAELHERGGVTTANAPQFTALQTARDYLHDRAAAPRLILDHLALVLPKY